MQTFDMTCPYRTSTFLIRKNKEAVENCLQITEELKFILKLVKTANLILRKIRLNIPFKSIFKVSKKATTLSRIPKFSDIFFSGKFHSINLLI